MAHRRRDTRASWQERLTLCKLPERIRSAVLSNARSKVVFQTTYDDARVFARGFGRSVSEDDVMNLGQFEVLCRFARRRGSARR
jgi:hypothetical protein